MSTATTQLHPLFRPDSLYRLATNEWLWFDEGETAIKRFFEAHRRAELHQAWADEIPNEPQDWGYDAELNAGLHEHLLRQRASISTQEVPKLKPALGAPAESFHCPVLRFEIGEGAKLLSSVPEHDPQLFGEGAKEQPRLTVNLRVERPNRRCLLLLISEPILRRLEWLNRQPLTAFPGFDGPALEAWREGGTNELEIRNNDPTRVANILTETFQNGMTEPSEETTANLPQFYRAWWTSLALGQAVGVAGVSQRQDDDRLAGPRLRKSIALHPQSPRLADLVDSIWAVLCIGPEATSSEPQL